MILSRGGNRKVFGVGGVASDKDELKGREKPVRLMTVMLKGLEFSFTFLFFTG